MSGSSAFASLRPMFLVFQKILVLAQVLAFEVSALPYGLSLSSNYDDTCFGILYHKGLRYGGQQTSSLPKVIHHVSEPTRESG